MFFSLVILLNAYYNLSVPKRFTYFYKRGEHLLLSGFFKKRYLFIALGVCLAALLLYLILPVSVPLITAFITALFLDPLVRMVQKRGKFNRKLSVLFVFLGFLIFIGVSGYFIVTKVITEAIQIVEYAPQLINEINQAWFETEEKLTSAAKELPKEVVDGISNQVQTFLNRTKNDLVAYVNIDNVRSILTNIPSYLVSFLVYLIALFLFLLDLPRIKTSLFSHLTDKTADKVNFMSSRLSFVIIGFFKAQLLVSVLIFFISLMGLVMITPKVAVIMATIIWVIDFIPIFGSIVIMAPWALFHLFTGDVVLGTKLAILAIILLIIRRTVEPKVMGTQIGLSALTTLIAMYLGLKLLGILGFIFGPLLLIAFNSAKEAGMIKLKFKI